MAKGTARALGMIFIVRRIHTQHSALIRYQIVMGAMCLVQGHLTGSSLLTSLMTQLI